MTSLTQRQVRLLEGLQLDQGTGDLVRKIEQEELTPDEIEALCMRINDEFLAKGLQSASEPNLYGHELEELLDVVNRPRLR